ncbi:recombinase family protein [Actinomyces marmotae]|uniref:recombinase family protein n=1 Tax=Actinomyces marmotae TaxID=2737173 RepID=UPI0013595302|nr:recombinase family protein [Actinomyces marmotae]
MAYLPVSSREQARFGGWEQGFFIPAQRAAYTRKAMSLRAIIVKKFIEGGLSAATTQGPALQDMLRFLNEEAAARRGIDYVIVHKLDRPVRDCYNETALGQSLND